MAGLAVGYAGTVAGAQAEEAKAVQFADGTATIAKAQATLTLTGAVGGAAKTATSASAAASVALTAALTAAATAYVEAVAGAQRDLAKSLAAIGHAREVAGIDAAATHAHAVLSADVSRDTALAGVNLDFSQRRTALSLEIATAGADLVQAKMIQSAVEGTKASLEATERAWNEWIATLHERRSAGYGFWELVSVGSASGYGGGPTHPGNGADGFGLRDWLSLGLGSIPGLGTALAFIEFGTGMDYVAGRAVDQRLAGVGLLAALLPGGRILGKGAAVAARHGDKASDLLSFLRNAAATFTHGSVFNSTVIHRGNIVIQRSDIPLNINNLRRMQNGNSPFVRNAAGEWESLSLHHVGRQNSRLIEVLSSHNIYNPVTGGPLHIPGPGGPLRQSGLSYTYWQSRLEDLIRAGRISVEFLRQLGG